MPPTGEVASSSRNSHSIQKANPGELGGYCRVAGGSGRRHPKGSVLVCQPAAKEGAEDGSHLEAVNATLVQRTRTVRCLVKHRAFGQSKGSGPCQRIRRPGRGDDYVSPARASRILTRQLLDQLQAVLALVVGEGAAADRIVKRPHLELLGVTDSLGMPVDRQNAIWLVSLNTPGQPEVAERLARRDDEIVRRCDQAAWRGTPHSIRRMLCSFSSPPVISSIACLTWVHRWPCGL